MKKDTLMQSEQFVISYELLHLLHWLLKYEEGELSKLITKSFLRGIKEKKHTDLSSDMQLTEDMQNSVLEFFSFIEQEISDISPQKSPDLINKDIVDTIDHTDPNMLDSQTIKSTLLKTISQNKNDKQKFLKELLKQWKPNKEAYKN